MNTVQSKYSALPKIVMINDASVGRGGATGLAILAAQELAAKGRDVTFLSGDEGDNPELLDAGVKLWGAGGTHIMKASSPAALTNGLYNRKLGRNLSNWISANDSEDTVYHLHGWSKIFSPAVIDCLRPVFHRVVIHAHDFFLACPNGAFWNYPQRETCTLKPLTRACIVSNCDRRSKLQKLWRVSRTSILRRTLSKMDAIPEILLIHPGMKPAFVRSDYDPDRLTVLRNPVVPFCSSPINPAKNKMVAFVGRLDSEKGALVLAKACQKAEVPLMVIGTGPEEADIAKTGARMHGWCDRQMIGKLLKDARCLVMPSQYPEPYGLVAVEALGSGLPVIISQTAMLAQEILDAGAGYIVDATQEEEIIRCLVDMANDDEGIFARSREALRVAPELGLSLENWIQGLEDAYARSLNHVGPLNFKKETAAKGRF